MKVIVLSVYNKYSANYKIVLRLVEELKRRNIEVFQGYFVNDKVDDQELSDLNLGIDRHSFIIQPLKSYLYLNKRYDDEWMEKSIFLKLLYLFGHPCLLTSLLSFYFSVMSGFRNCKKEIEKLCCREKIDLIIAVSNPFVLEKLVSNLKLATRRCVFRLDPYAFNPSLPTSGFRKRMIEERLVISKIDMLYTTKFIIRDLLSDSVIKNYSNKMCQVEFPVISESDSLISYNASLENELFVKEDGYVYILHAGSFYRDIRNPRKLVEFIKLLPKQYRLCVAGANTTEIREVDEEIRERVIDLGALNSSEVELAKEKCDYLLSYNNLSTNMVPSKLFECIDSGKPFINLCQSENCPSIDYVRDYEMAFTVITGDDSKIGELVDFLEKTKGQRNSRERILSKFGNFTIRHVVDQMLYTS